MVQNLASKHTVNQDVVHRLKLLGAKRTSRVTINSTLLQQIGRPKTLLECKPEKEFAFSRTFDLPKQISASKNLLNKEEGLVGRADRVTLVTCPTPDELIRRAGESWTGSITSHTTKNQEMTGIVRASRMSVNQELSARVEAIERDAQRRGGTARRRFVAKEATEWPSIHRSIQKRVDVLSPGKKKVDTRKHVGDAPLYGSLQVSPISVV